MLIMGKSICHIWVNLFVTNELVHVFHLDESTFIFRDIRTQGWFLDFISFFNEIHLSKQSSHRWNTTFFGISSGATIFASHLGLHCLPHISGYTVCLCPINVMPGLNEFRIDTVTFY